MAAWLKELFGSCQPVIAMAHVAALPGTPRYDAAGGMRCIVERLRADVECLLAGGVDAIMFCNEDDRPYSLRMTPEQIAAMARVVSELAPKDLPFGVDMLWDPVAALAVAHATGAAFIREVLTGTYESDMGLWAPDASQVLRLRRQLGAESVRIFFNVVPEFASALGSRSVAQRAHSAVVSSLADAILISGPMAGAQPDLAQFYSVKEAIGEVPLFMNTGARADNVGEYLQIADGVIVGSSLKVAGYTWNPVEPARVKAFMAGVAAARQAAQPARA